MSVSNRLVFDPGEIAAAADGGSNVGAYLRAGTDGTLIGHTAGALNVALTSVDFTYDYAEDAAHSSADVGAYILAVRQDSLATSTSADGDYASFKVNAAGALYVDGSQYTQPVSATDLDIRDLAFATDSVDVSGSSVSITGTVGVTQSTSPWVVSGTQIDIDDLNATDDAVSAWVKDGSGNAITSTGGALDINIASGFVDADDSLANTSVFVEARAVSTTLINITAAAAIANRKWLYVANEGNKTMYIGPSGTTASTGFPIHPGMQSEFRIGAAVTPMIIGETGSSSEDIRVMQLS